MSKPQITKHQTIETPHGTGELVMIGRWQIGEHVDETMEYGFCYRVFIASSSDAALIGCELDYEAAELARCNPAIFFPRHTGEVLQKGSVFGASEPARRPMRIEIVETLERKAVEQPDNLGLCYRAALARLRYDEQRLATHRENCATCRGEHAHASECWIGGMRRNDVEDAEQLTNRAEHAMIERAELERDELAESVERDVASVADPVHRETCRRVWLTAARQWDADRLSSCASAVARLNRILADVETPRYVDALAVELVATVEQHGYTVESYAAALERRLGSYGVLHLINRRGVDLRVHELDESASERGVYGRNV